MKRDEPSALRARLAAAGSEWRSKGEHADGSALWEHDAPLGEKITLGTSWDDEMIIVTLAARPVSTGNSATLAARPVGSGKAVATAAEVPAVWEAITADTLANNVADTADAKRKPKSSTKHSKPAAEAADAKPRDLHLARHVLGGI